MRNLFLICLMLSACARASQPQSAQVIENKMTDVELPSLENNMAATVSVFTTYSNPDTGEIIHDQSIGVVLDSEHVLTFFTEKDDLDWFMEALFGWKSLRIDSMGVMPYVIDPTDHMDRGPAPAEAILAVSIVHNKNVEILELSKPLSLPRVTFAANKPAIGEATYVISHPMYADSDTGIRDTALRLWSGTVVKPEDPDYEYDFALKFFLEEKPSPAGVFNKDHEFVGFVLNQVVEIVDGGRGPEFGCRVEYISTFASVTQK